MPGESTGCDLRNRRGLIEAQQRRRAVGHPGKPSLQVLDPNDCWSTDKWARSGWATAGAATR
jgi:hypothetical protein